MGVLFSLEYLCVYLQIARESYQAKTTIVPLEGLVSNTGSTSYWCKHKVHQPEGRAYIRLHAQDSPASAGDLPLRIPKSS